ncbi:MAG: hypothetical protein LC749_02375 [Actinobacteria bacterium]|nr:hypothetical protein [Actinomycetota bacterium]
MRSADEDRPAWLFAFHRRGVIFVRKWDLGEKRRPVVQLGELWRNPSERGDDA